MSKFWKNIYYSCLKNNSYCKIKNLQVFDYQVWIADLKVQEFKIDTFDCPINNNPIKDRIENSSVFIIFYNLCLAKFSELKIQVPKLRFKI